MARSSSQIVLPELKPLQAAALLPLATTVEGNQFALVHNGIVQNCEALRHEVRLRATGEFDIPDGAKHVATEPDGTLRISTKEDPLLWVAKLDPTVVTTVEIGSTNLEPLYRRLTEEP